MRALFGLGLGAAFLVACGMEGGAVSAEAGFLMAMPAMAVSIFGFLHSDLVD